MIERRKAETVWIGLGSNLGDRLDNIRKAATALAALPESGLHAASGIYETSPIGKGFGSKFYNAVVGLQTSLSPQDLLTECRRIETALKRDRQHSDRTIDLDILLYGDRVLESPELQLPHHGMTGRRFVLEPMSEIAPDVAHPVTGKTIKHMLDSLKDLQTTVSLNQSLFPETAD